MENNFGQFYQDFIKNSLMPKEREDYNKALKTFKLTQEDFLEFLEDIIDNHFIEVDGEIIPDLSNLAQSKLIKALGTYDNSKIKKEQEALKNLNQHLLSFFTIVENYNLKVGVVDDDYNQKVGNANKVLFDRFAHLNNTPTKEIEFKGYQSFTLKRAKSANSFLDIINKLKHNKLIARETSTSMFQKIFSGAKIQNNEKVNWVGNNKELTIFLIAIEPKLVFFDYKYETAVRCFLVKGKEIIESEQISNSSGTSSKKQIIEDIISLF
jgi:hypothetical protein